MSPPNVVASTGSAGTSIYSEIGATPVIATSISSMIFDVATAFRRRAGRLAQHAVHSVDPG